MAKAAWIMIFGTLACAGCDTLPKPAKGHPVDTPYQDPARIQYLSHGLSERAEIVKSDADRTESGLLRLRLVLRNHVDHDVVVEVKVTFTDSSGFAKEETNWESIILGRHDDTTFSKVSLGAQVTDYRIAIRDPKRFSQK